MRLKICLIDVQIGNALGFVRMVRMGQQHYSTAAAEFIPVKGTTLSFESSAKAGKLTGETADEF